MPKIRIDEAVKSVSITHKFNKSELIFLNTSDILNGEILSSKYMKVEDLKGQAKKTIRNGDILFSEIRPKNRRFAFVDVNNPDDYIVSTKLMVLRNNNPYIIQRYFYYFVTSEKLLSYLQMRAESRIGSFPQITFDLMAPLTLDLPSLEEQKIVIHKLDTFDSAIKNNNHLIESLEKYIQLLFHKWFVDFNFPNENGEPYKDSGGEMVEVDGKMIPKGWSLIRVNELAVKHIESINPSSFPGTVFKYFSIPAYDERGLYMLENGENIQSGKFTVPSNSILVSKLNPWFKRVIYPFNIESAICSTEFVVLVPNDEELREFLFVLVNSDTFIQYCSKGANGTSNSHKRVSPDYMTKFVVAFNLEYAKRFNNLLIPIINKIETLRVENHSLIEMRDLLINKLIK